MATLTFFNSFGEAVLEKKHNFASDVLKLALSNTAPSASADTQLTDITQISTAGGYPTGGLTLDSITSTSTGGVATVDCADEAFTATGADTDSFRYVVLYNDTATNDELVCYWDLGASQVIANGNTTTFGIDASGLFDLSYV